jgi:hypothetical protein
MRVPIESEKGFAVVGRETRSPRNDFERQAEEIARAAEVHVRRMVEEESRVFHADSGGPDAWAVDPESLDAIPFGLKRRVVLRIPVFRKDAQEDELRRVRSLMAQLALDLIAQVIEINRYFAAAGLVPAPEAQRPPGSSGNTMSGGSAGSSFRRRA